MMRDAPDRRPVRAASTRWRRRLGKTPGSRWASAAGVSPAAPRIRSGRNPAPRTISSGTDGEDTTTVGSALSGSDPTKLQKAGFVGSDLTKAAVSVRMALEVVTCASDDPRRPQPLDSGRTVSEPLTVDQLVVLADRRCR